MPFLWKITKSVFGGMLISTMCSCAQMSGARENFNFAFYGPPRPSEEATLQVYQIQEKFGGSSYIPYVLSVDGNDSDKEGRVLYRRKDMLGFERYTVGSSFNYDIRLSPGTHVIEVKFQFGATLGSVTYAKNSLFVSVNAEAGKIYDLLISSDARTQTWTPVVQERRDGITPPRHMGPLGLFPATH